LKRIGIVLNNAPSYSETFFNNKINCLKINGFEVLLFAHNNEQNKYRYGKIIEPYNLSNNKIIRVLNLVLIVLQKLIICPIRSIRFIRYEYKIRENFIECIENLFLSAHIISHKLDWLHFGFATTALRKENVAKVIGAKMAVSFRGYDITVYPLKHPNCYKFLWERVDKVHTISDFLRIEAIKMGLNEKVENEKITPAIDINKYKFHKKDFSKLKIVTIARLNWVKGIIYALHAMKLLKNDGIDFEYTVVGSGDEIENLIFATYQLGISDNVNFLGKVNEDCIPQILSENNYYLQPSIQEGFCNAVLEAQSAGLITIVSDADGLKENVLNNITGFVIPKRNHFVTANKLKEINKMDRVTLNEICLNANSRINEKFNLKRQSEKFIGFYN